MIVWQVLYSCSNLYKDYDAEDIHYDALTPNQLYATLIGAKRAVEHEAKKEHAEEFEAACWTKEKSIHIFCNQAEEGVFVIVKCEVK